MSYKFFVIPVGDEAAEAELNSFLGNHRVLYVDRHFVNQGSSSFWSLCVDYLPQSVSGGASTGRKSKRGQVDYKEKLSPEDFAVYAKLRDLRKELAQTEAVPVYAVFTNEQLAQMVT